MFPERCLDVPWNRCGHFEPRRSRTIAAVRRRAVDPTGLQPTTVFQGRVALPIDCRPSAIRLPRRELARITRVIESLDQAIHPTKAQRLVDRFRVGDRCQPGVLLMEDEPHLRLGVDDGLRAIRAIARQFVQQMSSRFAICAERSPNVVRLTHRSHAVVPVNLNPIRRRRVRGRGRLRTASPSDRSF